jgi:hypothetical protein
VLNSFTDVLADRALKRARAIDAARAKRKKLGPLAGVPFAVKNLFDVKGLPTRAGSKINRDLPPAARDQPLIERLEAAGAILIGALNMGEYAYDFTGENVHDGNAHNPHDVTRMTGGSSSGSGGAVAGGLVPLSLGSDTNGSIRVPSSFCGLFGLKPTYGRLSRARSFPFVASLDHLGRWHVRHATSRSPTMRCRGAIRRIPFVPIGRSSRRCRSSSAVPRACASRSRVDISGKAHFPRRLPRWTASLRRYTPTPRPRFPRQRAPAPPPT